MVSSRISRGLLLTATGLMAVMICSPAMAQDTASAATAKPDDADTVVVVKGIRKSLQSSADKKRRSAQITDTVTSEDVGKLPDNNVVEALAHVTGVQITRARGEGESLMIRGQSDIQTTVNGSPNNTGVGRSASLNDIPAELLKEVTVYKTRTADQVEGGIAGTVNVELRRPLDLRKGWTLAGSVRNVYSSIGDTESPYASALIAKRFDTPAGEMGFLLNLSYQETNYNEQYVQSETPALFWCCGTQWNSVPHQDTDISIYRAQYGVESGKVRRPALNASYQWRINDNLDIVLEGSTFNSHEARSYSALNTRIKDSPGALSNIVYQPDGHTIRSMTVTLPSGSVGDGLPVGPTARDDFNDAENQRVNFELHWHNERATFNVIAYRDNNSFNNQWYTQTMRLKGLTGFAIDMDSAKVPGGGPWVDYVGADPGNINSYNMYELENGKGFEHSTETVWQADLDYRVSDDKFLRKVQVGVRHSDRDVSRAYGYRFARFGYDYGTGQDKSISLLNFPGGSDYVAVHADIDGFDSPTWYRMSRESMLQNFDAIRAYAVDPNHRSAFGGSGDWGDKIVATEDLNSSFTSNERSAAIYGQLVYGFDAWKFPVDGVIGIRSVHTWGFSDATSYKNGVPQVVKREGEGTDTMPNVNAVVHFSNKLQLRLAYTQNVQRPNFQDSSSFVMFDTGCHCGWGGNPELKPNRETSYDASLEYYFGRGGAISFATYLKKPDNFIVWGRNTMMIDDDNNPATPTVAYFIDSPANAGPGEYQGFEFAAQGFFDFLPGFWKNFGAQANITYNAKAEIRYKFYNGAEITPDQIANIPGIFDAPNNSKMTYNLALYYETPKFSARLAYNYRDRYRGYLDGYAALGYSQYIEPTSRLDLALNYTPVKFMTVSLEGTNLLEDKTSVFYGQDRRLPQGVRVPARTIQLSARFRY